MGPSYSCYSELKRKKEKNFMNKTANIQLNCAGLFP